tara:strand:- start:94 stop:1149 length:1056 start_codon:yes stop_codon:yes gene_type:complete
MKLYLSNSKTVVVSDNGRQTVEPVTTTITSDGNVFVYKYPSGEQIGSSTHYSEVFQADGTTPIGATLALAQDYLIANTVFKPASGGSGADKLDKLTNLSNDGRLIIDAQLKSGDTEKTALIIQDLVDEDFRQAITVQGGLTANQRRYFQFLNHLGVRTNLLGFNAQNSFIAYDSTNAYHYISSTSGEATSMNSFGTFQVQINKDETATGNNGMAIYDGTANPTASNIMYNLNNAGIYLKKGRILQLENPTDANKFIKLFCTGSAYINSSIELKVYNSANKISFVDTEFADQMVFNLATGDTKSKSFTVADMQIAPASATATGTKGEIRYTTDYIYVCTATNTWKRTALTTW